MRRILPFCDQIAAYSSLIIKLFESVANFPVTLSKVCE